MNASKKKAKNKKPYKHKKHFCIFCKNEFTRLAEHFLRRHKNEDKVKDILSTEDIKEKMWKWKRLRQQGDHFFNNTQVGVRKIVKVPLRPSAKKKYFDCPTCLARLRTCSKVQHQKVCKSILKPILEPCEEEITEDVFHGLPEDLINKLRSNLYVTSFLQETFETKDNRQIIRTMARDILNFEEQIKKLTGQNRPLTCFFKPTHVDDVIRTIKVMGGYIKGNKEKLMRYPYKAQRQCRMISNFCKYLTRLYSKRNMDLDLVEVTKFLNIFESDSDKLIRKQACRSIRIKNLTTPKKLPKTSEINILIGKLKDETPKLISTLQHKKIPSNWRNLAENVLCRLTIFNRRRGGAVEKMKVSDYTSTEVRLKTTTEESEYNLSAEERDFLKNVRVVEILHKCNNIIPIFITKELQIAMDVLLKNRQHGEINNKNDYFFAASKKSLNPISGVRVLEKYREVFPDEIKHLFTATNLRKHGATVAQVLDLTPQDKEEWAFHMGHSVLVHNRYYKKPEEVSAVLKTGRILTAMDEGALKFYKGKKISDIPLTTTKVTQESTRNIEANGAQLAPSSPCEASFDDVDTSIGLHAEETINKEEISMLTSPSLNKAARSCKDFYRKSTYRQEKEHDKQTDPHVITPRFKLKRSLNGQRILFQDSESRVLRNEHYHLKDNYTRRRSRYKRRRTAVRSACSLRQSKYYDSYSDCDSSNSSESSIFF